LSDTVAGRYAAASAIGMLNGYKAYHVYRKLALNGTGDLKNLSEDTIRNTNIF
jgi:hypothetical protein